MVNLKQRFQFNVIPNFSLFLIFVVINDLVFFASDPFLEIINIRRVVEEVKLLFGGLFALEHGEVVTEFVALDE